jgi:hypothetical protein
MFHRPLSVESLPFIEISQAQSSGETHFSRRLLFSKVERSFMQHGFGVR